MDIVTKVIIINFKQLCFSRARHEHDHYRIGPKIITCHEQTIDPFDRHELCEAFIFISLKAVIVHCKLHRNTKTILNEGNTDCLCLEQNRQII